MRVLLPAAAAAVLALAFAGSAYPIGITLSPGSASTSTTLNGVDQEPTFTIAVNVTGANTSGWRLTAWAARPTNGTSSLPALEVPTQPTVDPCTGKNCTQPTPTGITWPVTLGTSSAAAAKIYNAALNTGDGAMVVRVPFGVRVPSNVLSGTYTTSITITITNNGP